MLRACLGWLRASVLAGVLGSDDLGGSSLLPMGSRGVSPLSRLGRGTGSRDTVCHLSAVKACSPDSLGLPLFRESSPPLLSRPRRYAVEGIPLYYLPQSFAFLIVLSMRSRGYVSSSRRSLSSCIRISKFSKDSSSLGMRFLNFSSVRGCMSSRKIVVANLPS